jgi:beta-glucosidase-like glycosyl hydrolase
MGKEHVGKGVNIAPGRMMNTGRVAQGGRNWEGFGADPSLAGVGAYEAILGMQSAVRRERDDPRGTGRADVDIHYRQVPK